MTVTIPKAVSTLLAIVCLCHATPATANTMTEAMASIQIYDAHCEKLPRLFAEQFVIEGATENSVAEIKAGQKEILDVYKKLGTARWCAVMKPHVENAMRTYTQ